MNTKTVGDAADPPVKKRMYRLLYLSANRQYLKLPPEFLFRPAGKRERNHRFWRRRYRSAHVTAKQDQIILNKTRVQDMFAEVRRPLIGHGRVFDGEQAQLASQAPLVEKHRLPAVAAQIEVCV